MSDTLNATASDLGVVFTVVDTWFSSNFLIAIETLEEEGWKLMSLAVALSILITAIITVIITSFCLKREPKTSLINKIKKKGESVAWLNEYFQQCQPEFSKDKFHHALVYSLNAALVRIAGPSTSPIQIKDIDLEEMKMPKLSHMKFHYRTVDPTKPEQSEQSTKKRRPLFKSRRDTAALVENAELHNLNSSQDLSRVKLALSCVIEYDDRNDSGIYLDIVTSSSVTPLRVKLSLLTARAYLLTTDKGSFYSFSFRKLLESKFIVEGKGNEMVPAQVHSQLKHALEHALVDPMILKWQSNKSYFETKKQSIAINELQSIRLTIKKLSDVITSTTGPYRYVFSVSVDEPEQMRKTAVVISNKTTTDIFKFVYLQIRKSSLIRIQLYDQTSSIIIGSAEITGEHLLEQSNSDIHVVLRAMLSTAKATKGEIALSWVPTGVAEPESPGDESSLPSPLETVQPQRNNHVSSTSSLQPSPTSPLACFNGILSPRPNPNPLLHFRNGYTLSLSKAALEELDEYNEEIRSERSMVDHDSMSIHSNISTFSTWDRPGIQPLVLKMYKASGGHMKLMVDNDGKKKGGKKIYSIYGHAFERSKSKKGQSCFATGELIKASILGTSAYKCIFCHEFVKKENVGLVAVACKKSLLPHNIRNLEIEHISEQVELLPPPTQQLLLEYKEQQLMRQGTPLSRTQTLRHTQDTSSSHASVGYRSTKRQLPSGIKVTREKTGTLRRSSTADSQTSLESAPILQNGSIGGISDDTMMSNSSSKPKLQGRKHSVKGTMFV